ncbi:hypothetical protein GPECTOR_8g348 [Gonium pectorale]|uniref:Protein kinase domain-containing protein n=1 Tax=Gonium pectorale TaxID=33097 RepID=A0A150GT01_GONPE|nr:hypothetical protein GPECTOR_8g348 [Gonium pectorale]|eukprot:KXZ52976.1 hypothetical protein GPECTOR_8g348 [Gonium pectorale]
MQATCKRTAAPCALKTYRLSELSPFLRHQVLRELSIHSRVNHPGVAQLIAAFKEGDLLVLVQEYIRGGSLDRLRRRLGGRLSEFQARHLVLRPLLAVLAHLHGKGIMHRDIKPENLLVSEEGVLKVCDFGVSVCLAEERPVTRTGSREYMAPEVAMCPLKRGPGDGKDDPSLVYGPSVDVWSLGALTYELLVGFTPFPGGPPTKRRRECAGEAAPQELAFPATVSQAARAFVRSCLQADPADRPTVQQLLRDSWLRGADEVRGD